MIKYYFVSRAKRNYSLQGIKKGESYWWWHGKRGKKVYSKTEPKFTRSWNIEDKI